MKKEKHQLRSNISDGSWRLIAHALLPWHRSFGLLPMSLPRMLRVMGLPSQPITLSVEQVDKLNQQLSTMRHDINNTLSLITAAVELLRYKPHMAERMMVTLLEQPPKITTTITQFSTELEQALGIFR